MVMHASLLDNTGRPLCRTAKFRYVTTTIENVTCERCILEMAGRTSEGMVVPAV